MILILILACGGRADDTGRSCLVPDPNTFAVRYLAALCEIEEACAGQVWGANCPSEDQSYLWDLTQFEAFGGDGRMDHGSHYDPEAGAACVCALEALSYRDCEWLASDGGALEALASEAGCYEVIVANE